MSWGFEFRLEGGRLGCEPWTLMSPGGEAWKFEFRLSDLQEPPETTGASVVA